MAHVYVYSPSGAVRDRAAFRRGVRRLQALGHDVEVDTAALLSWQRFAGDDATRLAAIGRAAASGADVTLISRGGYGLSRLLPDLPWRAIARAAERGTHWVGFSDFTALQLGLLARHPATTWAGPALCEGFGAADGTDAGEGQGGVLFLEDVGEHPYRIERMLTQLLHAGVLARQKLIVLGRFTDYSLTPHDRGYSLAKVVDWLRAQLKAPVLTGLPFGHVPTKVLLPVGAEVSLSVEGRDALIYWGHAH